MEAHELPASVLGADLQRDLRVKHQLLAAACRCLEDEACYRFFDVLASLSALPADVKGPYLDELEGSGEYDEEEMKALRRLVMEDGARAFRQLLEVVREIRVQQEIEQMMRAESRIGG